MSRDHDGFDTASGWEEGYEADSEAEAPADPFLLDQCARLVPGAALDLGCGAGANAVALAQAGWTVTGIDWARNAVATARDRAQAAGVDIALDIADITRWTPDKPYDLVVSSYALPTDHEAETLAVAVDALADGGTLLVLELDPALVKQWSDTSDALAPETIVDALAGLEIETAGVIDIDRGTDGGQHSHNHDRSIFVRAKNA